MKINQINTNISHKGLLTNKAVLKGLEFVSEHSASVVAGTSFIMASGIRPLVISKTPDVDSENKKYLMSNSIISGLIKFATVEAIAIPVENAIKKIDKTPQKYLSNKAIETLKGTAKDITQSGSYKFATQILKLSTGLITAIPKSMLTIALIPVFMNKFFNKKNNIQPKENINKTNEPTSGKNPSFKGAVSNLAANGLGKVLSNNSFQNYVIVNKNHAGNIARDISIATDILLTGSFINRTKKSKEIEKERKNPLIYNSIISTTASIIGGYSIDKAVQSGSQKFIKKFTELNKNDPKLPKYIEGINILRPTLIFAGLYYGILPLISTYLADKTDKFIKSRENTK